MNAGRVRFGYLAAEGKRGKAPLTIHKFRSVQELSHSRH
jgi:hypothetical protein